MLQRATGTERIDRTRVIVAIVLLGAAVGAFLVIRHAGSSPSSEAARRVHIGHPHPWHPSPAAQRLLRAGPPLRRKARMVWLRQLQAASRRPISKHVGLLGRVVRASSDTLTVRQYPVNVTVTSAAPPTHERPLIPGRIVRVVASAHTVLKVPDRLATLRPGTAVFAGGVMNPGHLDAQLIADLSTAGGGSSSNASAIASTAQSTRRSVTTASGSHRIGSQSAAKYGRLTMLADATPLQHPVDHLGGDGIITGGGNMIVFYRHGGFPPAAVQFPIHLQLPGCVSIDLNVGIAAGFGGSENWPFQFQTIDGRTLATTSDSVSGGPVIGHLDPQSDYTFQMVAGGLFNADVTVSCGAFQFEITSPVDVNFGFENLSTDAAPLTNETIKIPSIGCPDIEVSLPELKFLPFLKDWTEIGLFACDEISIKGAPVTSSIEPENAERFTNIRPPNPVLPGTLNFETAGRAGPSSSPYPVMTADAPPDIAAAYHGAVFLDNFQYSPTESNSIRLGLLIGADIAKVRNRIAHTPIGGGGTTTSGSSSAADSVFGDANLKYSVALPPLSETPTFTDHEWMPAYLGVPPQLYVFHGFDSHGRLWPNPELGGVTLHQVGLDSGTCSGAFADPANDLAYRCFGKTSIYDPCFGDPSGTVDWLVCPLGVGGAIERFDPTAPPTYPNKGSIVNERHCCPWLIRLSNGDSCTPFTGTRPQLPNGGVLPWGCGRAVDGAGWLDTDHWPWVMHLYTSFTNGVPQAPDQLEVVTAGWS